ncbi:MAG TPA: hypothetical protein ENJ62_05680 [Bryobacterales bacterium]|nr:hypothetical protein [Bryobacterales bacterium]
MKRVDERRLEEDRLYRFEYLREFVGFDAEDESAIRSVLAQLAPRVPQMVEATYEKLLAYDATARHFVPRQAGYDGPTPTDLASVHQEHPQIRFRKEHLQRYFLHLLGHAFNEKMVAYLDMVGKMHTPEAGNPAIDVPLVQMNALMGLVSDILWRTLAELDLAPETFLRVGRAFNKLLWIQNDFISRHYARGQDGDGRASATERSSRATGEPLVAGGSHP